jgi:hypothetical protein
MSKKVSKNEKIRQARQGKKHSPLTKERMSKSHTGKKHSEETKRKISETMKNKNPFRNALKIDDPWSP